MNISVLADRKDIRIGRSPLDPAIRHIFRINKRLIHHIIIISQQNPDFIIRKIQCLRRYGLFLFQIIRDKRNILLRSVVLYLITAVLFEPSDKDISFLLRRIRPIVKICSFPDILRFYDFPICFK